MRTYNCESPPCYKYLPARRKRRQVTFIQPFSCVILNAMNAITVTDLTQRRERFAQLVAELGNQSEAYRRAFDVGPTDMLPVTVRQAACRLAAEPAVAARIRELLDTAVAQATINTAARLQWLHDIETADPNEVIAVVLRNCRWCRGVRHKYQYRDEGEYLLDCAKALDEGRAPEHDDSGGYGFNGALEPVSECPECHGDGIKVPVIADTTKLTGKARKLYKGARVKPDGSIEILLHDQLEASDQLNRILGLYRDDVASVARGAAAGAAVGATLAVQAATKVEEMTDEQAARLYLELANG